MSNEPENQEPDAGPPASTPPQVKRPRVESTLGAPVAPVTPWQLPAPPPAPARPPAPEGPPVEAPKISIEPAAAKAEPEGGITTQSPRLVPRKKKRPFWVWTSFGDSVRNFRSGGHRLAEWWRHWRTTASFRVLLAFLAIYGLLAVARKPSERVVERSQRADGAMFLQDFLKRYCAAGGTVFAARTHGGSEIYPRGVVLQDEMLVAFHRATAGETFTVKTSGGAWNPLSGFYGYPPVFVGGVYFSLERKFNFALYEYTFLLRKDSERVGAILIARVEVAP